MTLHLIPNAFVNSLWTDLRWVWLKARASMQAEMVLKEEEAEKQKKRIQELEEMQKHLKEALQLEIKARMDEEAFRYAQTG